MFADADQVEPVLSGFEGAEHCRSDAQDVPGSRSTISSLGDEHFVIEPGEAVEFTTWTPHWFGAIDEPVELIMIVGPQGERLHLHPEATRRRPDGRQSRVIAVRLPPRS